MQFLSPLIAGALALIAFSSPAQTADLSARQAVQITAIEGVRSTSNGYFVIRTTNPVSGCEAGFWIPASDAKHAGYFARVNDALSKNSPVIVAGDRDQLWPGSTEKVCRITQLQ